MITAPLGFELNHAVFANASAPTLDILLGKLIVLSFTHPENAESPMYCTPSESFTVVNFVQPEKAPARIVRKLPCKVTSCNYLLPLSSSSSIILVFSCNVNLLFVPKETLQSTR